jgi:hypothetical protein
MHKEFIYSVDALLKKPELFIQISEILEGPESEVLEEAFHTLLEDVGSNKDGAYILFKSDSDQTHVILVVDGFFISKVSLQLEWEWFCEIDGEEEFQLVSRLYEKFVRTIEQELPPSYAGNIALLDVPCPSNGFLQADDSESFMGYYHTLEDVEKLYEWVIKVTDPQTENLKAFIERPA